METVTLEVQSRANGSSAAALRREKIIPAVYYGQGEQSQPIQMDYQTFRRVYIKTGSNQLIDLSIDGEKAEKVLVHDVQFNSLSGQIDHVDFLLVNLKEKITADVPVELEGEAPAVKDLGGILNTVKHEITVKCLPMELPHEIKADVSGLAEFSAAVHVSDLKIPEGVEVLDNPEDVVVIVNAPRVEEEPVAPEEGEEGVEGAGAEGEEAKGEGEEAKGEEGDEAKEE